MPRLFLFIIFLPRKELFVMRRYTLVSREARERIDLRNYEDEISDAVMKIMPEASVIVYHGCYTVNPTPTQSQAVRIGREICQTDLREYCIFIPKLFCGAEMEVMKHGEKNQQLGGHFGDNGNISSSKQKEGAKICAALSEPQKNRESAIC